MKNLLDTERNVHLKVDFFDEEERKKLLQYPTASRLNETVSSGANIPMAQFLTYYLFHQKRSAKVGYRNYREISEKISRAINDLEDWVDYQDGSLNSSLDAHPQIPKITENIGEAAALSVMGRVHDVHDADWNRIPEKRGRSGVATFDYEDIFSSSDGERIVQVEAKGTAVENSAELSPNVKAQKRKLDEKKSKITSLEKEGKYPVRADLRYGVVCSLGRRGPLHCRLTDPPIDVEWEPRRYRLLKRLEFMFDWVSFLIPRSHLAASFATRLVALQELTDPFLLSNVPLLRGDREKYEFDPFGRTESFLNHLCRVTDGPAVGTMVRLLDGRFFFLGVQKQVFEMAASQAFNTIMNYRHTAGSIRKTIRCNLSRSRAKEMGVTQLHSGSPSSTSVTFEAEGVLHYSQSYMVFGIVTPTRLRK